MNLMKGHWWKYRGMSGSAPAPDPVKIFSVYGEDYLGTPPTFICDSGQTMSKTGSPGAQLNINELGNKYVLDINSTGQYFTIGSALSTEKKNYAVFTVTRYQGSVTTGFAMDFRDGGNYKMIIPVVNTTIDTTGWYYGQSGSLSDFSIVAGESTSAFKIRVWLFEDNEARVFLGGGTAVKGSSNWEDTALDTTLTVGFTPTVNTDMEIAHISIYSLPLGNKFQADDLDVIGQAIQTFYSGGTACTWTGITV